MLILSFPPLHSTAYFLLSHFLKHYTSFKMEDMAHSLLSCQITTPETNTMCQLYFN